MINRIQLCKLVDTCGLPVLLKFKFCKKIFVVKHFWFEDGIWLYIYISDEYVKSAKSEPKSWPLGSWSLSSGAFLLLNLPSLSRERWERARTIAGERSVCCAGGRAAAAAQGAGLNNIKQVLEKGVTSRGAPNKWANFHAFSLKWRARSC